MPRNRFLSTLTLLAAFVTASPAVAEIAVGQAGGMQFGFEGLIQGDGTWYSDDITAFADDRELRRAELILRGKAERWDWVLGYDPSERNEKWLDVNARFRVGERWRVTVGQFKQANSLEELTSTRANDFISKAMVTNTFGIARRLGVGLSRAGDSWDISGGWFGHELTPDGAEGAGYGVRASWTPVRADERIIHLGISGIDHDGHGDQARFRSRPGMDMSTTPRLVDTGNFTDADRVRTFGLEAGWVQGPFKLQGEYMRNRTSRFAHADFTGDSWYLSGVWNLSGETWGYRNAVFTTASPTGSAGMWQLAARVEGIDLDDGTVRGGSQTNAVIGVNWYWGAYTKLMLNYVRADVDRRDGRNEQPSAIAARVQLHW